MSGMSGGDCDCMSAPADLPIPLPTPLLPLTIGDLITEIPETAELVLLNLLEDTTPSISIKTEIFGSIPSHNSTQAILGIWRL